MSVTIDLSTFAREIDQPAPIHFQRRANKWLALLRERARKETLIPIRVGEGRIAFDFLDALRSELNLRGGNALSNLSLAQAILARFPDEPIIEVDEKPAEHCVSEIARLTLNGDARIRTRSRVSHWYAHLRTRAYQARRELNQLRRSVKQSPIDASLCANCPTALALPRLPNHLTDVLPVARLMRELYQVRTVFLVTDEAMKEHIEEADFPALYVPGLLTSRDAKICAAQSQATLARLDELMTTELERRAANATASDVLSLEEAKTLAHVTGEVLHRHLEYALRVSLAVERCVAQFSPALLFASNPYTLEGRVATCVARSYDVPTASVEHGSIFPDDPIWQDCSLDLVCAWGEPSRRALLSCGVREEQIAVTGAPRFDNLEQTIARRDEQSLNDDARDDAAMILVATSGAGDQVSLEQHRTFIEVLYQAAERVPDVRWVVKLHKKDRAELYQEAEARYPAARVEIVAGNRNRFGTDIFDFLKSARALVTVCSTSALDAMLLGVPVISVSLGSEDKGLKGVEFLERGCTQRVCDAESLSRAAARLWRAGGRDAATDEAARDYVAQHYANLGRAGEEVAARLHALMNENHGGKGSHR